MAETTSYSIEQFYKFINERRLMATRCNRCGALSLPPKPICSNCLSKDLSWTEIEKRGRLATFTIIHIAPTQFQSAAPYASGILELSNGLRLPGMIRGIDLEKINVGIELEVDFESNDSPSWPQWSRYFFRPP